MLGFNMHPPSSFQVLGLPSYRGGIFHCFYFFCFDFLPFGLSSFAIVNISSVEIMWLLKLTHTVGSYSISGFCNLYCFPLLAIFNLNRVGTTFSVPFLSLSGSPLAVHLYCVRLAKFLLYILLVENTPKTLAFIIIVLYCVF
jgi:hypothetical protein